MPFTALNQAAPPSSKPPANVSANISAAPGWIKEDFSELPTDVTDSIVALWNGEARAYNIDTTQKVISELRHLIVELKANIRLQTTTTTINRAETPSRKRNSEDEDLPNGHVGKKPRVAVSKSSIGSSWKGTRFEGVSFTVPQRKKLSLTISSSKNEGLIASGSGVDTPEFGVPWSQVEHVMCLPVPEKTQAQRSFIVFPRGVDGLGETTSDHEMMVWTVPDTKTKGAADDEPTQAQAIKSALSQRSKLLEPDPTDFTSEIPPAGSKKGEKAYHIKAFKGSKDGYLFLLPTGIIWAFKKPLIFFSFATITSISYTSVLQRTFNLVISAHSSASSADSEAQDYEFSMLDQTDFAGIDKYIRTHGLQDASLAEQRRAKVYNVNGIGRRGGEDEAAELEKAGLGNGGDDIGDAGAVGAVAAVDGSDDDEEEEDENFDPGSDGESEGSGSEDDDDDQDRDEGEHDTPGANGSSDDDGDDDDGAG